MLVILSQSIAQDMSRGYQLLEEGSYEKAGDFFQNILKEYPNNKTANICYGRALGLNGNSRESIVLFLKLKKTYPSDLEVDLNIAEALMWEKQYDAAAKEYQKIIIKNSENFTAQLGIANAYASLNKSVMAHQHIEKALSIQSENESAKISKKYILLAIADKSKTNHNFDQSLKFLNVILKIFPDDREALLNKAITYLWMDDVKNAATIYEQLSVEDIDVFEGTMGLSYTATLLGNKNLAIKYAEEAVAKTIEMNANGSEKDRASLNLINCLAIKGKYNEAKMELSKLISINGHKKEYDLCKSRLDTWQFNFKESLKKLNRLNESHPGDFEILMGLAEVHRGLKNYKSAIKYIDEALIQIPLQADAMRLREEILSLSKLAFSVDAYKSKDVANNHNTGLQTEFKFGSPEKVRSKVLLQLNTFSHPESLEDASQYIAAYSASHELNHKLKFEGGVQAILATDRIDYEEGNLFFKVAVDYQIRKNTSFSYEFGQDNYNFNVELLKRAIKRNNHNFTFNHLSNFGTGVYLQYILSHQTDDNTRNLFTSSVYHNILSKPVFQAGLNYSNLSFAIEKPQVYFSPKKYMSTEAFIKVNNFDFKRSKLLYHALIAVGKQKENEGNLDNTIRIEGDLGYRFARNVQLLAYYRYSSLDNSTATGFTWNAFGLRSNINF